MKPSAVSRKRNSRGVLPGDRRWPLIAIATVTLIGAGMRFYALGVRDFWYDESCTFIYVYDLFDWPAGVANLFVESTNLPYYVVLRGWAALFGHSELAYRAMSALAAALTVPLLAWLCYRMAGWRAAAITATLAAFHPLHIYYAHEARAYALWMVILSGAMFLLYEAARRGRWRWWAAYGAALLLCLPTHYFTMYWVPATAACVAVAGDRRRVLRQWLITTLVVAVLFAPYLFAAVLPAGKGGGNKWINKSWEPVLAIPRTVWALLPAGDYPTHLRGLSLASSDTVPLVPALDAVTRLVPAALLAGAVFFLWSRRRTRPVTDESMYKYYEPAGRTVLFIVCLTFVPIILVWLYSVVVRPNYFVGRYDMVAWPGFILFMALVTVHVSDRLGWTPAGRNPGDGVLGKAPLLICLLLVTCSAVPIVRFLAWRPPPSPHRQRAEELARLAGPDDLAVTLSYDREYMLYYLRRAGFKGRIVSFPSWLDNQVGWLDTDEDLSDAARLARDAGQMARSLAQCLDAGLRVWWLKDSMPPSRRFEINRHLEELLKSDGFTLKSVSPDYLIYQLQKPGRS